MSIPWWAKIGAKLVLSRLPFGYAPWQRLGLFRHGQMDTSEYAIAVFHSHVDRAGLAGRLQDKVILELGPGDSLATAVVAATYGARAILVDTGAYARFTAGPYHNLQRALESRDLRPPDLSACTSLAAILERCAARYHTEGLASLREIESASIDLLFSQAVLEHVRYGEFFPTLQECRRVLRAGGICSHQIDLRDHLGGLLNNLRFSNETWESEFFASSGFYTNRIRYARMLELFEQAGFSVECTNVQRWETLPTPRRALSKEFAAIADDDLRVSAFDVLLR
jgi:SAM-dependent methyltransferase